MMRSAPHPAIKLEKRDMAALEEKVAVVTGASRGIGAAAARHLAEAGAAVALLARSEEPCRVLAEEIQAAGGRAIAVGCDVSSGKRSEERRGGKEGRRCGGWGRGGEGWV